MKCKLHVVGLVAAALATRAATARADRAMVDPSETGGMIDPAAAGDVDDDEMHVATAAAWAALEIAIPAWYYWHTQGEQEVDWTYPSWKDKLTLHSVRFDTNPFHVNAIRHPLAGVGDYLIARSNGFGAAGSTLFAYLTGAFWEF